VSLLFPRSEKLSSEVLKVNSIPDCGRSVVPVLCANSVNSVVRKIRESIHHRDTEHTGDAQRNPGYSIISTRCRRCSRAGKGSGQNSSSLLIFESEIEKNEIARAC